MNSIRACLTGSGDFQQSFTVDRVLSLVAAPKSGRVSVAYVGTASYDLPSNFENQTTLFAQRRCAVRQVQVADPAVTSVSAADVKFLQDTADIILVSRGNTLYAVRRWEETGLAAQLTAAAARGTVLAGGSAGAICWFTAGHSDSADPATYLQPSLKEAALRAGLIPPEQVAQTQAELAALRASSSWSYIRVHGLKVLPGLFCPHFDEMRGGGVRREDDFAKMLRRHPTERGIGLDDGALLVLKGDGTYEVAATPDKTRAASPGDTAADAAVPGLFTLDVVDGAMQRRRAPTAGRVETLLRAPSGPVVPDPFERYHAMENPTPSSGSLMRR